MKGEKFRACFSYRFGPDDLRHIETSFCPIREKGRVIGYTEVTRDITKLKQAEEELRESRVRHQSLTEQIPDMVYRMSLPDGKYEYVSPASEKITGYTPEEYYSSPKLVTQQLHPDFMEYFWEQWSRLLEGHAPTFYEYAIFSKSGELRWLNQRNTLIKDDRGRPVALEGVVTDITDRKKAELELKESRELFKSFMENLPGDAYIRDGQDRYIFVNRQFLKHAGLKPEEVYGKTDRNLFPRKMAVEFSANDQVIRSHGQTFTFRAKVPSRNNGSRQLIVHKFPVRTPDNENLIGGMAFDISKELKLHNELGESESRFQEMADLAPVFLVELDIGLAVTYANRMARTILARTTVGLNDGSKVWPVFPAEEIEAIQKKFELILQGHKQNNVETEIALSDGTRIPLLINAAPIEKNGSVAGVRVSGLDLTLRKRLEKKLAEREQWYRSIFEVASTPVVMTDQKGCIVTSNQAFADLVGHPAQGLRNQLISSFFHTFPDHGSNLVQLDQGRYALKKEDSERVMQVGTVPFVHGGWKLRLSFMHDATDQVRIEEEKRKYQEWLRLFTENMPGVSFIKDLEGRYVFVNEAFAELAGTSTNDILCARAGQVWEPETAAELLRQENQVLRSGELNNSIVRRKHNGKSQYWYRTVFPINGKGEIRFIGGICIDMTPLVEAEKRLESQKKELEEYSIELRRSNIALDVVLKHQQKGLEKYSDQLATNIKKLVVPYLEMVGPGQPGPGPAKQHPEGPGQPRQHHLPGQRQDLLPASKTCRPRELEVALLVKEGKSTLDISEQLCISDSAVAVHRKNIRNKLGLKGKKVNLRMFLQQVEDAGPVGRPHPERYFFEKTEEISRRELNRLLLAVFHEPDKGGHYLGIKGLTVLLHDPAGFEGGISAAVGALGSQGVEHVHHRADAGKGVDQGTGETPGIAGAVQLFVVLQDHVAGFRGQQPEPFQDPQPAVRVLLHLFKFLGVQPFGLSG